VQLTEQSNVNLQEGSATASNVFGADLEEDTDRHEKHKKSDGDSSGLSADQTADATVEQAQEIEQVNTYEQGSAIAIAVGEDSTATAVQISDQTNFNEQIGTAEAINVLMESAGMHVATASADGTTDVVSQDGLEKDGHDDKKGDDGADVTQTADASVAQFQSVEQANLNLNSSAEAIATDGSEAEAVQLTFQQNVNAQVASADALNVFLEDADEITDEKIDDKKDNKKADDKKDDKKHEDGHQYDGAIMTETTSMSINGDGVADADRTTFDYDGTNEQLNDVDQFSTAAIEQSQELTQLNLQSNNALAVADDDGSASAFQMAMQENENVQISSAESTTVEEESINGDDSEAHDDDKSTAEATESDADDDDSAVEPTESDADDDDSTVEATDSDADDEQKDDEAEDSVPGFGVAVALVALLAAAMLAARSDN